MPERTKDTGFWNDDFVQGLPPLGKLLFDYLWTNSDCNQAGLYHITLRTMAFDTGITQEELMDLLIMLEPKVKWWSELNLIWVKNFLKRQIKSPTFLVAVAKCLDKINHSEIVKEFLDYNSDRYGLVIHVERGVPSSKPVLKTAEVKEADTLLIPNTFNDYQEKLKLKYPELNIVEEWERCQIWYRDNKKTIKSPSLALGNWCQKEMAIRQEKKPRDTTNPSRYKGQKYDHMVKR